MQIKKIGKYLREVSVVVLGVAITLSVSVLITKRNEKRDLNLYLNAIKIELEENKITANRCIEYLTLDAKYSNYLKTHDKKSPNLDSLGYYATLCCYYIYSHKFKTNAFEAFKGSGTIRLLEDKELLLTIWDVYTSFISQNESLKWYYDLKWEHMEKEMVLMEKGTLNFNKLTNSAPMYNFFVTQLSNSILNDCIELLKFTEKTVSELEKRK